MFLFHGVHPKKISAPALILTLLFTALAGSLLIVNLGMADPFPFPPPDLPEVSIAIHSVAYDEGSVSLTFTANIVSNFDNGLYSLDTNNKFYFFLDSRDDYVVFNPASNGSFYSYKIGRFLSDGQHAVWVRTAVPINDLWYWTGISNVVSLTVDTTIPQVSILSPEPQEYNTSEVPLLFTLSEPASRVVYCLDGEGNVSLTNNATLAGLAVGRHSLVLYATDAAGHVGKSEVRVFDVVAADSQSSAFGGSPSTEACFPVTLVVASAVAAAVSFGLVAYFLRRRKRRQP
jgi:hypothetical protein